jgi:hypothetical protein
MNETRSLHDHETTPLNRDRVTVKALDGPGPGNASHKYEIRVAQDDGDFIVANLSFQNGPVKEAGANGITDEALYAVLLDRLRGFQSGEYGCRENAVALTHLETALMWLHKRTLDRERRGVEGTHQK